MGYQIQRFTWECIEIEVRYNAEHYINVVSYIEIEAVNPPRARLPITSTGYKSHYAPYGSVERDYNGDVVAAVTHWLNQEVKSKKWQDYIENARQGVLF